MRFVTPRGWATFAWQSDYSQFYLVDAGDDAFAAPVEITPQIEALSLYVPSAGLVVYTQGCLHQHIGLAIYDDMPDLSPTEPMSGKPWTRIATVDVTFPSLRFSISSPSHPNPLPAGPAFFLTTPAARAQISWLEDAARTVDDLATPPDVINIALWPR